ncbi:O-methyltransferase [Nonomuraea zeae]|uniref:SAM-dependent methyltransferase n=1 Tax=Nonomuraea zeae TaxID=1642303 RepID=A0A5S4GY54_9ACTN|nr:class I SAM-dependent methyltransferase [Nonomuraea zeae]TMR37878.1 SAM-dependent methyltransferase [Nonomuraea zeae]
MIHHLDVTRSVLDYVREHTLREDPVLTGLRDATAAMTERAMQLYPEEGELLAMLVRLTGARRTLEVGVFTGYSTLCTARALPPGGRVVALDVSEEFTAIARRFWARAGVADRIDLRLGEASAELRRMLGRGEAGTYDFAFLDADKNNYPAYWELLLALVRPGGLLVIDNTLWAGKVADPAQQDPDTAGVRALNELIARDERVESVMLPFADGVTLVRVR